MYSTYEQTASFNAPIDAIRDNYSRFRFIDPKAEKLMKKSIHQFGQITPVVLTAIGKNRYEMVDGFKRMRSCLELSKPHLTATLLKGGVRASKAAILSLNWRVRSIHAFEEALIIQSLCREDQLTQVEVAALLGRHKSWVCRRLSLAERLNEEIKESITLGLISISIARELAKLPRGNQTAALNSIMKHHLDCRETAMLVSMLLQEPSYKHENILDFPISILEERQPDRPRKKKKEMSLLERLTAADRVFGKLDKQLNAENLRNVSEKNRDLILTVFDRVMEIINRHQPYLDTNF